MWSVLPADADCYEKEKGKCGNMTDKLQIKQYVVGMVGTNCYLAVNGQTKETLIIDPGDQGDDLIHVMKEENLRPVAVLLTHGHFDHAGAAAQVAEAYHIPVYAHELERETLEDPAKNLSASMGGFPRRFSADVYVKDEQELDLAGFHLRVLLTPGHTPGGCCYYIPMEDVVFSGDSLFCGSIGRTDFPGGSMSQLVRSVQKKLMGLPDQTLVLPGHDARTTIDQERMYNPYL